MNRLCPVWDPLKVARHVNTQAVYFAGLASLYLGHKQKAREHFLFLKELGGAKAYPIALFQLAIFCAEEGKIPEAAENPRVYLRVMPEAKMPPSQGEQIRKQLQTREKMGLIPNAETAIP